MENSDGTERTTDDPSRHESAPLTTSTDPTGVHPVAEQTNRDAMDASASEGANNDGSIRLVLAETMNRVSAGMNENKIAVRYAIFATVGALGAYALSQTPLFFRYKTVAEIPSTYFRNRRKYIYGRLMICNRQDTAVSTTGQSNLNSAGRAQPVSCYIRHLSPMERILSKSWLDQILKLYPAASFSRDGNKPEESPHELIHVQIAGIQHPEKVQKSEVEGTSDSALKYISLSPVGENRYMNEDLTGIEWIRRLSEQRSYVTCQLLGRAVPVPRETSARANDKKHLLKRPIPGLVQDDIVRQAIDGSDQVAVARLYYRPNPMQWIPTDFGEEMVRQGYAVVSNDGLYSPTTEQRIVVDTTDNAKLIQRDAAYMTRLGRAEYDAAKGSYGIWSSPWYRKVRSDVVDEVEFQQKASTLQKIWRYLWHG